MGIKDTSKLLSQLTLGGTDSDADYVLRRRVSSVAVYILTADLAAGARIPVEIAEAKQRWIKAIRMYCNLGMAAGAGAAVSTNYAPQTHKGVGGGATALAPFFNGDTMTAVARQTYTFVVAPLTCIVPAGNVVEFAVTRNAGFGGAGRSDLHVTFEVEWEYV